MPTHEEIDRKMIRSSAWVALSSGGSQAITFAVMIVLARLLTPSSFGLVALASIPLFFLSYLQESGLGAAVIRRRTDVEHAAATQFVFATLVSVVLYAVSFAVAPLGARLFSEPQLTSVFRVLSLILIIRGLTATAAALLDRELAFAQRARGELGGSFVQSAVAVAMAVSGFGVWSLVGGQLAGAAVQGAIWWFVAPFRPSPMLASWRMLRELARYGRHITIGNVLGLVTDNADNAVIGRLLGAASVGVYNMAWRLANLPAVEISFIVGRVTFPLYATLQDDLPAFRRVFLTTLRRVTFVSIPVAFGILLAAEPLVIGIFGEKWRAAVAPLQILAVFGIVRTFAGITGAVFQACGRPQLIYWIGLGHAAVLFSMLFLLAPSHGVEGVAVAEVTAAVASAIPSYIFTIRTLDLGAHDFVSALERPLACTAAVAVAILGARAATNGAQAAVQLAAVAGVGTVVYAASMLTFGRSELRTITAAFRGGAAAGTS
jgi:PST family polysaccharide transporter/lipopolysaccharide exporter